GEGKATPGGRACGSSFNPCPRETGGGGACSSPAAGTPSGTSSASLSASRAVCLSRVRNRRRR
ncbi:unnamed protein product, partial [Ectocarpus sp. 6 AP-2014]